MNKVAFHTLGCKVNSYETESLWEIFKKNGYERVDFDTKADVYLINTCTVTNTGDKKSRQIIRRAIRKNPDAVVAVTGCYAQTSPAEVAAIPGVDIVVGTSGRDKIIDYVDRFRKERAPINAVNNIMKAKEYEELDTPVMTDRSRALLKIQEGCNNFCTFCIIPWAKGLSRSRKPENVLSQAQVLVNAGYKEIVLTGIHTGGYGDDLENYTLADLLLDLEKIDNLDRIRISSIEASQVDEKIIKVISESKKVCRHLHIPLQAGDTEILSKMRRKYTAEEYRDKVMLIKKAIPNIAITTDVIVGFPGEDEERFKAGFALIKDIDFYQLHVFPYSKRTGTRAAIMPNQVTEDIKHQRVQQLINLSKELTRKYSASFIGKTLEVIPEQLYENTGLYVGYTDNYIKVLFEASESDIGDICAIKITDVKDDHCLGYLIKEKRNVS